ncbi:hypothetical protein BLNAU_15889 [Blattamonas nauphoetae]|uniref:Uncharacterized protein n=1 Tax=Blattamonas nauphoetae TaxID=2049346 RepID=A0ABQ9X9D9_9EUKA|nr:hypothetical protein BLNAU_15889 [Blattamonas nauphoetae]
MQSEQNAMDALSKQDTSTAKHSKDFEDAQILRMVTEATPTKYGCGEKSSWLEDLLESEQELECLPIPFHPINSGAFWAMFDSDTRSPVLVWGEKDRQELASFLRNEMEVYAKLCATANKATDAAMKEDATFTLDPDIVSTSSVEELVKSVMVDGKPAFVFPSSMQYQSHANQNMLLHPPLVIFPPAPTLSHPRLVFTSSLSHVKVGEYYIDVLLEEDAPVLFIVHQHSVENVAKLLTSDERRKAGGSKTTSGSAERPPALSAQQLEASLTTQHIDTMRGIDDCSQFTRSLFAVSNLLLLAEVRMKRIECLGQVFGYLEQGLAESFDIQNSTTSSLSFAALPDLESSLATMHSSQSLQYDLSVLHLLLRFCVALIRQSSASSLPPHPSHNTTFRTTQSTHSIHHHYLLYQLSRFQRLDSLHLPTQRRSYPSSRPISANKQKMAKEDVKRLLLDFARLTFAFIQTTKRQTPKSEQQETQIALSRILRKVSYKIYTFPEFISLITCAAPLNTADVLIRCWQFWRRRQSQRGCSDRVKYRRRSDFRYAQI